VASGLAVGITSGAPELDAMNARGHPAGSLIGRSSCSREKFVRLVCVRIYDQVSRDDQIDQIDQRWGGTDGLLQLPKLCVCCVLLRQTLICWPEFSSVLSHTD
jgi:hypothetical protein